MAVGPITSVPVRMSRVFDRAPEFIITEMTLKIQLREIVTGVNNCGIGVYSTSVGGNVNPTEARGVRPIPEFINMTERGTVNWGRDIINGAKFVHHSVHGLVDYAGGSPTDERGVRPVPRIHHATVQLEMLA